MQAPLARFALTSALLAALLASAACRQEDRTLAAGASGAPSSSAATPGGSARAEASLPGVAPLPPDDDPPPPPAPAPPATTPLSEAQFASFLAKPTGKITAEIFETALLRIATCKDEPGWVTSCAAYEDLMKVVQHYRGGDGFPGAPALRHLRHPAVTVRGTAASFAASYTFEGEPSAEKEKLFLEALRSETDAGVVDSLVRRSGPGAARNPAIRRFVLRALAHPDEKVRSGALGVIARPDVAPEVPDAFARLAAATRADRPRLERLAGCEHVGKIDDPRAVPLLAALLADDSLPRDVRGACFESLVGTWTRRPPPLQPSREGYELTLRILQTKPRSTVIPHERGVSAIASAAGAPTKWSEQVRAFYDVREVSFALAAIVLDPDAAEAAMTAAVVTLIRLDQKDVIDPTLRALKERGDPLALRLVAEMEKELAGGGGFFGIRP